METFIEWVKLISGCISGLGIIVAAIVCVVKWFQKQDKQTTDIADLKSQHDSDMEKLRDEFRASHEATQANIRLMRADLMGNFANINNELCQMNYENGAMLDGLIQMGCNGEVTKAKEAHDKRINKQAHSQNI